MNQSATNTTASRSTRKPKVFRSKEQWQSLITQFHSSGLSKTDFCKKHKIGASSLHKWQKYFSNQADTGFIDISEPLARTTSPASSSNSTNPSAWQVELELGDGIVLRIGTR